MDGKSSLYSGGLSPHGYSYDNGLKASPNLSQYNERLSSESASRGAEGHSPYLHSFGPSSSTLDKAFQDDQGPAKLNAGKKSRLNLLNPMSLLARRRSSQNQNEATNLSVHTMHVPALPDNFDPSIRGTITHDFSAPRTRRNHSYGGDGSLPDSGRRDFLSPGYQPGERLTPKLPPSGPTPTHSPMFKEHFQDDRQNLRPADTGYLHNMAMQSNSNEDLEASMPAFARKLPTRIPQQPTEDSIYDRPLPAEPKASPPPVPMEAPPIPTEPPPPPPKRTPSPTINLPPASVLPKHMTSTSSRFSFQLVGQASSAAQEKLLEEKHKQAHGTRRVSKLSRSEDVDDDNYDDYDFDAEDMEEDIPLAGIDDDFDEDDGFGRNIDTPAYQAKNIETLTSLQEHSLQGFHFTPQSMTFSPTSTQHTSQPTPRDDKGFAIGIADSRDSPEMTHRPPSDADASKLDFYNGLGITTSTTTDASVGPPSQKKQHTFDDEDLYFDDGEFASNELEDEVNAFDEDALDDENQIRDIPAENLRKYEAAVKAAGPDGSVKVASPQRTSSKASDQGHPQTFTGQLTETNLAAYHDALANAANEAALNGKFRNISFSHTGSDDGTSHSQSQLGIISDESRYSYNNLPASNIAEDDGFPFDDDMDDDLMIAEANAEALENDDDGFYGQEFGFYARARGKDNNEMINGGFFAPRGSNGVKRSHSGRAGFQEPSLTPITERSEWSTRNSVASLQIPPGIIPGSAASLPSPGIAQLLELDSPGYGDDSDMTLSALMKLRRGAFGGSSNSVSSLAGSHAPAGGSPLGHTPYSPQDLGHPHAHQHLARLHSQTIGIPESEEEDDYDDGYGGNEPTLTQNTPMKKGISPVENISDRGRVTTPTPMTPQESSAKSPSLASPISLNPPTEGRPSFDGQPSATRKGHHSRTSSGAESVSYARDHDGRWVLERRRTGEDGGMEIEREWAGGRI
jgi:hypothetical protein